jgi:hypothetical protein
MVTEGLRPMEWIRRILENMANWADTADKVDEPSPQDQTLDSAEEEEDFGVKEYFGGFCAHR